MPRQRTWGSTKHPLRKHVQPGTLEEHTHPEEHKSPLISPNEALSVTGKHGKEARRKDETKKKTKDITNRTAAC